MVFSERDLNFIELYANKEELKLTHVDIAQQLGISTKTVQRLLKDEAIIKEINKRCASKLDRMLPAVVFNTEAMLQSNSSNDRVKGQESYFKLQEKLTKQLEATQLERDQELTHTLVFKAWELLGEVLGAELFLKIVIGSFKESILDKGYQNKISIKELNRFCLEHGIN